MSGERGPDGAPPVPGVWRLAWLLYMQPLTLHRMYTAWGLGNHCSLVSLWRRARRREPVARPLLARYALLLLVIMPLTTVLAAGALSSLGVPVENFGVALGIALGVTLGVMIAVTSDVAIGVAIGGTLGFTIGVMVDAAIGSMGSAPGGVICGVAGAVVTAAVASVVSGVALGEASGVPVLVATSVVFGVVCGGILWLIYSAEVGVAFSLSFILVFNTALFRLPNWLPEAFFTQLLAWRRPETVVRFSSWLPFLHHDLIYLPLPGLRACLIRIAERDPALGKELIALAAASIAQRRAARRALIELQAGALECAEFDSPFLPVEGDLASDPENAPMLAFLSAARDLRAGSTNQRQRRLALDRARASLESFRVTTVGSRNPAPLATRLLPAVALWLEVIRLEAEELAREVTTNPEVPSAFVAGLPLKPDRAEDRTLFKGRADIIKLIEHDLAPDRRGVLLVVGQRRMGKTSLCNWLPIYLGTGTTVIASNFQPLSGDAHRETPHRRVLGDIAARVSGVSAPPESARWGDGLRWLEELDRTLTDRKILVVIDEVERVEDGIRKGWCSTDFLDFLRAAGDALQNIRFLLLTAYPLHRLGPHWTDRLVSVTSRTISYLDEEDARELLTHPIDEFPDIYPPGGVDRILAETGRHPYLLQKAGDDLCRLLNSRGRLRAATADELTEVFDGMIREVQVFDEIWRSRAEDEQETLRRLARSDEPGDSDRAASQLVREGYLERRGDKVAFAVPLFREWIRENAL